MDQGTIGEIRLFAGNFAPKYWAFCDGQLLSVQENTALFSILGVNYGGDGRTTFGLPKMTAINGGGASNGFPVRYVICLQGTYPQRD